MRRKEGKKIVDLEKIIAQLLHQLLGQLPGVMRMQEKETKKALTLGSLMMGRER